MSEEIARLTVGVEGDQAAIKSLQTLDGLVEKLNKASVNRGRQVI